MDNKLTDNEIIKEMQEIRESVKRHIDLTNEMGQDLLRIDEEYTGGNKVWLTTDYFKKVVKHFCHSNYLVKCMELVFEYINRQEAEIERYKGVIKLLENDVKTAKDEAIKSFSHLIIDKANNGVIHTMDIPDYVKELGRYDPYTDSFIKENSNEDTNEKV